MIAEPIAAIRRKILRNAAESIVPASLLVTRGKGDRVALTFDDGPDGLTPTYLDVLEDLDVFATFFVLGAACARHPDALLEIVRRGHEVAIHGWSHKHFSAMTRAELEDEIERTAALLPPSPLPRALVRPPGGATSLGSLLNAARAGCTTVLWSIDSDDCRTDDPDVVVERVENVRGGDIVLLHEGQSWTLQALPRIVESVRAKGLVLSTVGEMLIS